MGGPRVNANSGTSITKKKDLEKYFLSRPPRDTDTFFSTFALPPLTYCTSTSSPISFKWPVLPDSVSWYLA